jgi:hypothetical protein
MVIRRSTGILALALLLAGFVMMMEAYGRAHAPAGNGCRTDKSAAFDQCRDEQESAGSDRPEIMSGE